MVFNCWFGSNLWWVVSFGSFFLFHFCFCVGIFLLFFPPCFVVYCFVLICFGDSDLNAKIDGGDLFMIVELTTCSLQSVAAAGRVASVMRRMDPVECFINKGLRISTQGS